MLPCLTKKKTTATTTNKQTGENVWALFAILHFSFTQHEGTEVGENTTGKGEQT